MTKVEVQVDGTTVYTFDSELHEPEDAQDAGEVADAPSEAETATDTVAEAPAEAPAETTDAAPEA